MLPSSAGNVTKLDESPGPGEARSGLSLWVRSPFVDLSKSGRAAGLPTSLRGENSGAGLALRFSCLVASFFHERYFSRP